MSYEVVPLSALRKAIAARMTAATQTIPHFRVCMDVELDALAELRRSLLNRGPQPPPSLNAFFVKACAGALMDMPGLNAQWTETGIHRYQNANIAIVTAVDGGVMTPILLRAETKSVWAISAEIKQLADRAARNALKMSEIAGGTFGISNLGMYGVDEFDAIINPPQCAMLAIGAAKRRLMISKTADSPRAAMMARMTLSVDHRAIDGVAAAQFLQALRARLEAPDALKADVEAH